MEGQSREDSKGESNADRIRRVARAASDRAGEARESIGELTPDAVRRATRATQQRVGDAFDSVTGKAIEEKIEDYGELYTQVLLGIHEDVKRQGAEIDELRAEVEFLKRKTNSYTFWKAMATLALALAGISVGGVVWLALLQT